MASYLITGSSRGLGLAMASRLASLPKSDVSAVFATARQDNSPQLRQLVKSSSGRVGFVPLDVTDERSAVDAAGLVEQQLQGRGLDVLINNAGVMPLSRQGLEGMNNLNETFDINVSGAHRVTRAFLPLVRRGQRKTVANISTTMGSFGLSSVFKPLPAPAYKITKAALNMLTVQYAQSYAQDGFTFMAISPGWLQTDSGGPRADLPVDKGAESVLELVQAAQPEQNGKFFNIRVRGWEEAEGLNRYNGGEVPW